MKSPEQQKLESLYGTGEYLAKAYDRAAWGTLDAEEMDLLKLAAMREREFGGERKHPVYELATLTLETENNVGMYHNWYTDEKVDFEYPNHLSPRTVLQKYLVQGWSHTGIEDRRQLNGVLVYYIQREKL